MKKSEALSAHDMAKFNQSARPEDHFTKAELIGASAWNMAEFNKSASEANKFTKSELLSAGADDVDMETFNQSAKTEDHFTDDEIEAALNAISEDDFSDMFDAMAVESLSEDKIRLMELGNDLPGTREWFNNWSDGECTDGTITSHQYEKYEYVGRFPT